mmetsp:Transcript_49023/g.115763  ORF Transcript_49023/g.115763 Transcript_49023/m.115763 type:complete len:276 (+) Transcript_49023:58-885(+)
MALYQSITDAFATSLVLEKPAPGTSVKGTEAVQSQKVQVGHWLHDTPAKPARHQPAAAPRPPQESGNWLDNATAFFSTVVEDGSKNIVTNAEALWHAPEGKIQAARAVDAVEAKVSQARSAVLFAAARSGSAAHQQRKETHLSRVQSCRDDSSTSSPASPPSPAAGSAPSLLRSNSATSTSSGKRVSWSLDVSRSFDTSDCVSLHSSTSSRSRPSSTPLERKRVSFSGPSTSPAPSSGAAATRGAHERFLSASSTPSAGVRFQEQDALLHTAFLF